MARINFRLKPSNTTGAKNFDITFVGIDSGSGIKLIQCLVDAGSWKECQSPLNLRDLGDGPHSVLVQAIDNAGNVAEISKVWSINYSAPYINITKSPDSFTKDSGVSFNFEVINGEGYNFFECQFDSAVTFTPCQPGQAYSINEDGSYTFRVRATNNQDYTSIVSYTFIRDTAGPTIDVARYVAVGIAQSMASSVLNAAISDGPLGVGVASVTCSYTFGNFSNTIKPCTFPLDFSEYEAGNYTVVIIAIDKLGTKTTSQSEILTVLDKEVVFPSEQE